MSRARRLTLIGIGTGNPEHVTLEGIRAMREAGLILIPRKGADKADLADLRRDICTAHLGPDAPVREFDLPVRDPKLPYLDAVELWHDAIAKAWKAAAGDAQDIALLIWGDPSLYDSSLRIANRLRPAPRLRVIPGITALQALTAAHTIPLNQVGAPVVITTGRRLRDAGWPPGADTVAVMLDGSCAFQSLDPQGLHIWWGAYLGMAGQELMQGPLADVADRIVARRAQAREDHGWIMDIYLLRRAK